MDNPVEIRKLAKQRLEEAKILHKNEMYDGAFYLAGYSVELTLKAKICERLGIPNLYSETDKVSNIQGVKKMRPILMTHDLFMLIIMSGLKVKLEEMTSSNKRFVKINSLLLGAWDEKVRYKPCGHFSDNDVRTLIDMLSGEDGLLLWIDQN